MVTPECRASICRRAANIDELLNELNQWSKEALEWEVRAAAAAEKIRTIVYGLRFHRRRPSGRGVVSVTA
jgi:hypothetical protein